MNDNSRAFAYTLESASRMLTVCNGGCRALGSRLREPIDRFMLVSITCSGIGKRCASWYPGLCPRKSTSGTSVAGNGWVTVEHQEEYVAWALTHDDSSDRLHQNHIYIQLLNTLGAN